MMKNICHENIVKMIDSYITDELYLNIILELCEGGSLQSKIDKMKKKVLKEKEVALYFF
jgi:serine/threonine protein kinase